MLKTKKPLKGAYFALCLIRLLNVIETCTSVHNVELNTNEF